jgi:hypothetical protein
MDRVRPLPCGCGQKSDVRLSGNELRAALDRLDLALNVPIAAAACEDAICARGFNDSVLGRNDIGIVELSRLAHVGEEVVTADMNDVDPRNRGDVLDVIEPLDRLDHAHEQAELIELAHALSQWDGAVVEMRVAADDGTPADGREPADLDRMARLGGRGNVGINDAGRTVVEQQRDVGIVNATNTYQRCDAYGERRVRDPDDCFKVEDRVLPVDENEIVAGGLGNMGNVGRTPDANGNAEGHLSGAQFFLDRIDNARGVLFQAVVSCDSCKTENSCRIIHEDASAHRAALVGIVLKRPPLDLGRLRIIHPDIVDAVGGVDVFTRGPKRHRSHGERWIAGKAWGVRF